MISRGFEFDVELLWRLRSAGFAIVEVPIEWQNKGDSRVRKRDMINMLAGLLAIRFHGSGHDPVVTGRAKEGSVQAL